MDCRWQVSSERNLRSAGMNAETEFRGRGARIRTADLLRPRQARYQAAPRPEWNAYFILPSLRPTVQFLSAAAAPLFRLPFPAHPRRKHSWAPRRVVRGRKSHRVGRNFRFRTVLNVYKGPNSRAASTGKAVRGWLGTPALLPLRPTYASPPRVTGNSWPSVSLGYHAKRRARF